MQMLGNPVRGSLTVDGYLKSSSKRFSGRSCSIPQDILQLDMRLRFFDTDVMNTFVTKYREDYLYPLKTSEKRFSGVFRGYR